MRNKTALFSCFFFFFFPGQGTQGKFSLKTLETIFVTRKDIVGLGTLASVAGRNPIPHRLDRHGHDSLDVLGRSRHLGPSHGADGERLGPSKAGPRNVRERA